MVCVIFFSGLDRQDGTSNQVLFSEDCQKPRLRLMMSSQQYRNISSSNIWSNHDISPEICCGSKWWLSPLNLRLRWSMSLTEHPNPIISVSAAHCMLALTTSQILCWQVSLRLLGKWMVHDSPSPTTVFSVAKRFLIPIVSWNHLYIPQNLPLEEMSKTNPEVWTHVLMRVPTWANLGHRRLQGFRWCWIMFHSGSQAVT